MGVCIYAIDKYKYSKDQITTTKDLKTLFPFGAFYAEEHSCGHIGPTYAKFTLHLKKKNQKKPYNEIHRSVIHTFRVN